jgi:hypothetical protein
MRRKLNATAHRLNGPAVDWLQSRFEEKAFLSPLCNPTCEAQPALSFAIAA